MTLRFAEHYVFDATDFKGLGYEMNDSNTAWARIKDFDNDLDKIAILNGTGGVSSITDLQITQSGADTHIDTSTMGRIILENTTSTDLDASDFVFGDGTSGFGGGSAMAGLNVDPITHSLTNENSQKP